MNKIINIGVMNNTTDDLIEYLKQKHDACSERTKPRYAKMIRTLENAKTIVALKSVATNVNGLDDLSETVSEHPQER